jgi:hypothetical protein
MRYKRYIRKFYGLIHKMIEEGLIDRPDKYVAANKVEIAVHELEQAFEQDISDKRHSDI